MADVLEIFEKWQGSPSPEHRELSARAIRWITNRMYRCYAATEVQTQYGTFDAVAFGWPTYQFQESLGLERLCKQVAICKFEAKATRSDFMAGFGPKGKYTTFWKAGLNEGNLCFLVKPRSVDMPLELLPESWGVLEGAGRGLRMVRPATWLQLTFENEEVETLVRIIERSPWAKYGRVVPCPDCGKEHSFNSEFPFTRY